MSSKKIDSSQLEKTAGGEKTTAPAGIAVYRSAIPAKNTEH